MKASDLNKEAWRIISEIRRNGESYGPSAASDTVRYHAGHLGIVPAGHSIIRDEPDAEWTRFAIKADPWL